MSKEEPAHNNKVNAPYLRRYTELDEDMDPSIVLYQNNVTLYGHLSDHNAEACCTIEERGKAAKWREEYYMPKRDYQKLCKIVHEKNDQPTQLPFPQPNETWTKKVGWKSDC